MLYGRCDKHVLRADDQLSPVLHVQTHVVHLSDSLAINVPPLQEHVVRLSDS